MQDDEGKVLGKRSPFWKGGLQRELFSSKCPSESSQEECFDKSFGKQLIIQEADRYSQEFMQKKSLSTQENSSINLTKQTGKSDTQKNSVQVETELQEKAESRLPPDQRGFAKFGEERQQVNEMNLEATYLTLSRTESGLSSITVQVSEKDCAETQERKFIKKSEREQDGDAIRHVNEEMRNLSLNKKQCEGGQPSKDQKKGTVASESSSQDRQEMALESLLASLEDPILESAITELTQSERTLFERPNVIDQKFQTRLEEAAVRYASIHEGCYVPVKVRFMMLFTFRCCLNHKFELSSQDVLQNKWCDKCHCLWETLVKTAKKKDSVLLDKSISPQVNIRCMRNHLFTLKPTE